MIRIGERNRSKLFYWRPQGPKPDSHDADLYNEGATILGEDAGDVVERRTTKRLSSCRMGPDPRGHGYGCLGHIPQRNCAYSAFPTPGLTRLPFARGSICCHARFELCAIQLPGRGPVPSNRVQGGPRTGFRIKQGALRARTLPATCILWPLHGGYRRIRNWHTILYCLHDGLNRDSWPIIGGYFPRPRCDSLAPSDSGKTDGQMQQSRGAAAENCVALEDTGGAAPTHPD